MAGLEDILGSRSASLQELQAERESLRRSGRLFVEPPPPPQQRRMTEAATVASQPSLSLSSRVQQFLGLPPAVRTFLQSGNTKPITQRDFTPTEITALKKVVQGRQKRKRDQITPEDFDQASGREGEPTKIFGVPGVVGDVFESLRLVLNNADVTTNKKGETVVRDVYDFDATEGLGLSKSFEILKESEGNRQSVILALLEILNKGRPSRQVRINLGKL